MTPAPPYPADFEALVKPLVELVRAAATGGPVPAAWTGPPLTRPVSHVALQPGEVLGLIAEEDRDERLLRAVGLAVQVGMCQGYAIAQGEAAEYGRLRDLLDAAARLTGKMPSPP